MSFYDRSKALNSAANTVNSMTNIISQAVAANSQSNQNIANALSGLSKDTATAVSGYLKEKYDIEKDLKRKNSLIEALEQSGAKKEIIDAAKKLNKSDDVLTMAALISNPKNIVSTSHSYGKVNQVDNFTGETKNFGESYIFGGKGGTGSNSKNYLNVEDQLFTSITKNQNLKNELLNAGYISIDKNGDIIDNVGRDSLTNHIADYYNNTKKIPDGYEERIKELKNNYNLIFK